MMKKAIIWGAGGTGRRVFNTIKENTNVIAFVDCDEMKWNTKVEGLFVYSPENIKNIEFDILYYGTLMGKKELDDEISKMGIPISKINKSYVELSVESRILFLKNYAQEVYHYGIPGAVAEAGVYRGEFARHINLFFEDRKCYLFDTFEGFAEADYKYEYEKSLIQAEHLRKTNEEQVYDRMPNKNMICIRKGYFPETAEGILDQFCFVNLDMDLYKPILEGLRFFYPKMVKGGILLIHDYFSDVYPNVRKAVDDFEKENGRLLRFPIGDDISLGIIR
jgi:O-methyltransferase